MARNGKIARLSLDTRNELNRRLQDGEPGTNLVQWLNGLEAVRDILSEQFGGVPISEQNLCEWRSGGHQDWLRHEEARDFMQDLTEQAGELEEAADGKGISDRFGALLAVDMARLAKKFLEQETDDEKRWERLKEISKELSRLRRDEHRATWTWIKRQKWERQREREDHEEAETSWKEMRKQMVAPLQAAAEVKHLSELYGGGPEGAETAAIILEAERDLEPGCLQRAVKRRVEKLKREGKPAKPVLPDQSKSDRIQPNPTKPTKDDTDSGAGRAAASPARTPLPAAAGTEGVRVGNIAASGTDALRPEPGKSGRIKPNQTKPAKPALPSDQTHPEAGVTIKVEGTGFKIEAPSGGGPSRTGHQPNEEAPSGGAPEPKASENADILVNTSASTAGNVAAPGTGALRPNPSESGQIKVNQTKSESEPDGPPAEGRSQNAE